MNDRSLTTLQQIALGWSVWELAFMFLTWAVVPVVMYLAGRQDKRLAQMQKEADEALYKWLNGGCK